VEYKPQFEAENWLQTKGSGL